MSTYSIGGTGGKGLGEYPDFPEIERESLAEAHNAMHVIYDAIKTTCGWGIVWIYKDYQRVAGISINLGVL